MEYSPEELLGHAFGVVAVTGDDHLLVCGSS
jgi:hypothetical protein